jgi:hypothetical protein
MIVAFFTALSVAAVSPHHPADAAVKITASCMANGRKYKCSPPLARDGSVGRWANVTGAIVDLGATAAKKPTKKKGGPGKSHPMFACKSVAPAPAGRPIALAHGGFCSALTKARLLAEAGYGAVLLVDAEPRRRFKEKGGGGGGGAGFLALPVATLARSDAKKLGAGLRSKSTEQAGRGRLTLVAMRKDGANWKSAATLYQEGKRRYLDGDTAGAVAAVNASIALDGRALPAHYTLANYACDMGDSAGARAALRAILPPPPNKSCAGDGDAAAAAAAAAAAGELEAAKLRIVTVATNERAELDMLRASLVRNGLELEVVGMGLQYSGLGFKIVEMHKYLTTVPAPGDVVMFTDAYDVSFTGSCAGGGGDGGNPGAEMLRRFAALGSKVVLGAELELNPDYSLASLLPMYEAHRPHAPVEAAAAAASGAAADASAAGEYDGFPSCPAVSPAHNNSVAMRQLARREVAAGGGFRYLNSGTYMGRAADLLEMFGAVLADLEQGYGVTGGDVAHVNDQRWFYRYLLAHPERASLDTRGELFHTLHWTGKEDYEIVNAAEGIVKSRMTGTLPCLLHGNGDDGKLVLDMVAQELRKSGFLPPRKKGSTKYGGW